MRGSDGREYSSMGRTDRFVDDLERGANNGLIVGWVILFICAGIPLLSFILWAVISGGILSIIVFTAVVLTVAWGIWLLSQ